MGLFSALGVGTRALGASQLGMEVTSQNISNADVEGYSRKRLNLSTEYRNDGSFGQMGFGVEVDSVERIRNTFLDHQIREQNQEVGLYSEINFTYESLENIFLEPSDNGLMSHIDNFFDSWNNLASNPADTASRELVKTNGEIVSNVFNNLSAELQDLRQSRDEEIFTRVEEINSKVENVYNLNYEIAAIEVGNNHANDSRDKRDQLLKELSTLIDIDVVENEVGQVSVSSGGNMIISPVAYYKLSTVIETTTLNDGSNVATTKIKFADSLRGYTPNGGKLRGLMDSRDIHIPEMEDKLDTLANGLISKVNEAHNKGYNLNGFAGGNFFDELSIGASTIRIAPAISSSVANIAAASAEDRQTAPTNVSTLTDLNFGTQPQQLSKANGRFWELPDPNSEKARNIVQGTVAVKIGAAVLREGSDFHIDYVNGTIQMLHDGYDNSIKEIAFDYNSGNFSGAGDNVNALSISELRHELTLLQDVHGKPTTTYDQFYASMIGELGMTKNAASSNVETREFLIHEYENHQDAISGVSLDEEMTELIKYQHTYQASAKIITTANKMLDILMNI